MAVFITLMFVSECIPLYADVKKQRFLLLTKIIQRLALIFISIMGKTKAFSHLPNLQRAANQLKVDKRIKNIGDIASDMGYSRAQTVTNIVAGKDEATTQFIKAFCCIYGVDENWLRGDPALPIEGMYKTASPEIKKATHEAAILKGAREVTDYDAPQTLQVFESKLDDLQALLVANLLELNSDRLAELIAKLHIAAEAKKKSNKTSIHVGTGK